MQVQRFNSRSTNARQKKHPSFPPAKARRTTFILVGSSILFAAAPIFAQTTQSASNSSNFSASPDAQTFQTAQTEPQYGAAYHQETESALPASNKFESAVDVAPEGAEEEEESTFLSFVKKSEFAGSAVIAGHQAKGYNSKSGVDGAVTLDLEWTLPLSETDSFYGAVEAGDGGGIDMRIPSFCGLNFDPLDDTAIRICELSYDHEGAQGAFRTRIGYLDFTSDFDTNAFANDENSQFMSYSLINNTTIDRHPLYSFGALAWWTPSDFIDAGIGYYESDDDGLDIFGEGLLISEIATHTFWGELKGNYRGHIWTNTAPHQEIGGQSRDDLKNYGWGLSCDQEVTKTLGLFGRYGTQRGEISEYDQQYTVGFEARQFNAFRPDDVIGFGYGTSFLSNEYVDATPNANLDDEKHFELYYRCQIKDFFAISPSIQWLKNPAGDADAEALWVPGLRANAEF